MSKKIARVHHAFYFSLFVILFLSVVFLLLSSVRPGWWEVYHKVYFAIMLAYTWYVAILLFIGEVKNEKFAAYGGQKIAVIIPTFNEEEPLFRKTIQSLVDAEGNKELFVIDDGSTRGMDKTSMAAMCAQMDVQLHVFEKNKGKRHALHHAITQMIKDHDFIVTIDSDTILDKYALVRVVEPLLNPKVGASTGDVLLLNEKQNVLTRMIGSYYWIGLNIFKKAQSALGMVVCCSGCLAAYRSDVINEIIEEFVNQKFLGEACTHSEDRHLTNLVLRNGYDVKYAPLAKSYTESPSTVKGFLKQQQRWKRGFIRESTFTLTHAWRTRPLLFVQILLCELTVPFMSFGLMVALFVSIFTNPMMIVTSLLPSWIMFMFVRYIMVLFYGRGKIFGLLVYMFFYEIFLYWQFVYALFTVKNKSWITRV
jgi:hyaluronan synthase